MRPTTPAAALATPIALLAFALPACVPAGALAPSLAHQRSAIAALAAESDDAAHLLRLQVESVLAIRRAALLGDTHRAFLRSGWITPDAHVDEPRFRADLADPAHTNALIDEVRSGRLSPDEAVAFLRDYALAAQMSSPILARDDLLASLAVVQRFDRASRATLESLDRRRAETARLAQDALRTSDALDTAARPRALLTDAGERAARALWERLVLARLADPVERAAASELLTDLLTPAAPRTTLAQETSR